jgi:hypothetical protein
MYTHALSITGDITPLTSRLFTRNNKSREALLRVILAHLFISYSKSGTHQPMYLSQNALNEDHRPFGPYVDYSMTVRGLINNFIDNPELFTVKKSKKTDSRITKERKTFRPSTEITMTPKLYGMFYEYGWKVDGLTHDAQQLLTDTQLLRDYHSRHIYKIGDAIMDTSSIRRTVQKDGSLGRLSGHPWLTQTRSGVDCSNWSIDGDTDLVMLDFDQFAPKSLAILNDLEVPSDPYPTIKSICGEYQLTREIVKTLFAAALSPTDALARVLPKSTKTSKVERLGKYTSKSILDSLISSNPVIALKYDLAPNRLSYQYRSLESDLMMITLQACHAFGIGICSIHDGVFCRRKDVDRVKVIMLSAVDTALTNRGLYHRVGDLTISLKQSLSKPHKTDYLDQSVE